MEYKKALIITFSGIGDAVLTEVLCENLKKMDIFDQGAIVRKYKKLAEENPKMYVISALHRS